MRATPAELGDARWSRFVLPPLLGLAAALLLFWWMYRLIQPAAHGDVGSRTLENIEVVAPPPRDESQEQQLANAPAPPPDAPPSLARPDLPSLPASAMATAPLDAGPISVPVTLGAAGLSITGRSGFAGFAGRGGGGGGGGGNGTGLGFKGKPLVPLSTARPQMPDWACKQKIRGWVEVVFTVMPNGHVQNVKLVDASPRGVFEAAAIESISNWIYDSGDRAREVKQRVEMNPEDCVYNWKQ